MSAVLNERITATIRLNENETLRIGWRQSRGRYSITARVFFTAIDGDRPSKKGLEFPVKKLPQVVNELAGLLNGMREGGVLRHDDR